MFVARPDMRPLIAFVWFVRDHGSPIALAVWPLCERFRSGASEMCH
jgi:hypothetical protein